MPIHLDGARLFNAAVACSTKSKEIIRMSGASSVNLCLSKGIGAPVGSVLAGSGEFIDRARRSRKMLGGGWRQAGGLAAAALVALESAEDKIRQDHKRAKQLSGVIRDCRSEHFTADSAATNIVFIETKSEGVAEKFCERLEIVTENEGEILQQWNTCLIKSFIEDKNVIRLVTHNGLNDRDIELAGEKIKYLADNEKSSFN